MSNGGGAAIAAAEQDTEGLIDGVAVGRAAASQLNARRRRSIVTRGSDVADAAPAGRCSTTSRSPTCYSRARRCRRARPDSPGRGVRHRRRSPTNRCAALKAKGLLSTGDHARRKRDGRARTSCSPPAGSRSRTCCTRRTTRSPRSSITMTYANAYGRFSVRDNLCGYRFGATDAAGKPAPLARRARSRRSSAPATACRRRPASTSSTTTRVGGPVNSAIVGLAVDRHARLQRRRRDCACATCGPAPTRSRGRVQTGVERDQAHGQPARQAGDHRARPRRHADPGELHVAAVLRHEQDRRGRGERSWRTSRSPTRSTSTRSSTTRRCPATTRASSRCTTTSSRRWTRCTRTCTASAPLPPSQVVRTMPRGGTPGAAPAITAANVPPIAATPAAAQRRSRSRATR